MPFKDKRKKREYQNTWMKARREAWMSANGPCHQCGSWDQLQVDHIVEETKVDHRIWSWSRKRLDDELRKCQPLCRTCHEKKNGAYNASRYRGRPCVNGLEKVSRNVILSFPANIGRGKQWKSLRAAARDLGVHHETLRQRIIRMGLSIQE